MSFSADVNIGQAIKCVSDALRLDSDNRVKVNMLLRVLTRRRDVDFTSLGHLSFVSLNPSFRGGGGLTAIICMCIRLV